MASENYFKEGLTANHIVTNLDKYEAARSGFFTFIVDDLDGIVKPTYSGETPTTDDRILNAQEALKLNVTSCSVPNFKVGTLEYKRGNETVTFAGRPDFGGSGTIKVDDVIGLRTKDILLAWKNLAYNPFTRKTGRMVDYKKTCTLVEYSADYEPLRKWTIFGAWISELREEDFDKSSEEKRSISVTFVYDRAIPEEI